MPIRCRTFSGSRCCEARHSPRRQGEMCRCAHECDVLELSVCSIYPSGRRDVRFCWDCCHALCILSVRCEQRAHDRTSGYGLGLRLTYYFHDKHFICFYDPNACACDQCNLTVIDKMLAGMYTVCIDELRQVKQHGTEKLKKGSISDG